MFFKCIFFPNPHMHLIILIHILLSLEKFIFLCRKRTVLGKFPWKWCKLLNIINNSMRVSVELFFNMCLPQIKASSEWLWCNGY